MAAAMPARPRDTAERDYASEDRALPEQGRAQEVIGEMACLLSDTRTSMLLGAGILSAVTLGTAMDAGFSHSVPRSGVSWLVCVGLLIGLTVCWLTTVTLLILAGRPVLCVLSDLRWRTGAPLDPRVRWLTLPPIESGFAEWSWMRAHLLVSAARLSRERVQLALTWTFITSVVFLGWTASLFLGL